MAKHTPAQEALYAERRMKALKLSTSGHDGPDIVRISQEEQWEPAPYNSRQAVWADIQAALKERLADRNAAADTYLQNELEKLDRMEEAAWKVMRAKHFVVNQGVIVYIGVSADEGKRRGWHSVDALRQDLIYNADGTFKEPLEDDKPVLEAIDRLIKIQDQRAKLTGIYAPVKKQLEVSGAADNVAASIERIVEVLASGAPGTLTPAATAGGRPSVLRHPRSVGLAHRAPDGADAGVGHPGPGAC